jgi:hypothetical protein
VHGKKEWLEMTSPSKIKYNCGVVNFIKYAIVNHQRNFQGRFPLEIWMHIVTFEEFVANLKGNYGYLNTSDINMIVFMQTRVIGNEKVIYPTMRDCNGIIDIL